MRRIYILIVLAIICLSIIGNCIAAIVVKNEKNDIVEEETLIKEEIILKDFSWRELPYKIPSQTQETIEEELIQETIEETIEEIPAEIFNDPRIENEIIEEPITIPVEPKIEIKTEVEEIPIGNPPIEEPIISNSIDRTQPLYRVFKDGWEVTVEPELQWYIRDMCEKYGFTEKYVYGTILVESCFQNIKAGNYYGLCMISPFWIHGAAIEHFTSDYESRNLLDPYQNLLTLAEMWCYASINYNLDLMTEDGMMKVCYWHNTGKDPRYITHSSYFDKVRKYGNELIALQ